MRVPAQDVVATMRRRSAVLHWRFPATGCSSSRGACTGSRGVWTTAGRPEVRRHDRDLLRRSSEPHDRGALRRRAPARISPATKPRGFDPAIRLVYHSFARFEILMPPSILIVARDGAECTAFEHLLRDLGTVESAGSGRAALMRLGMTDFACLVIASPVPVEFGTEPLTLMELVERIAPNLASRVVIVTDEHEADVLERARDLGVHELLLRPLDPADLHDAVARCLRQQTVGPVPESADARPRANG